MNEIVIAFIVIVVIAVVLAVISRGKPSEAKKEIYHQMDKAYVLLKGETSERKDGIIQLDRLLGKALEYAGVRGESVGERLKGAKALFDRDKYNAIWDAHKIRNRLVHEQYDIGVSEAQRAGETFTSAIRRLVK